MTTKHTPATPLPWLAPVNYGATHFEIQGGGPCRHIARTPRLQDAAYITHAANSYQKLVEALRELMRRADEYYGMGGDDAAPIERKAARALLRSLGEDA